MAGLPLLPGLAHLRIERRKPAAQAHAMKAVILLYPGAEELDALGPYEVLRSAQNLGADLETTLESLVEPAPMTLARGAIITPHGTLSAGDRPDILIVPGGGWGSRSPEGAWAEATRPETLGLIRRMHDAGAIAAGVCTGTMLLARAGLLNGRPAITHHVAIDELREAGAIVTTARVVDDGNVVTCGGVTSGLDLALWLVERFCGAALASATEHYLEYERRGTVWRAPQE
jgi:transcriptional regulator GlxA family with amidase domain